MKERPILFSAPMVRALLAGTKTQTRRVVKPQPTAGMWEDAFKRLGTHDATPTVTMTGPHGGIGVTRKGDQFKATAYVIPNIRCPYGQPSDRLWVRETWRAHKAFDLAAPNELPKINGIHYEADEKPRFWDYGKIRPSIHMPRWASRITLEITGVRVERLNEISEEDAKAEGCEPSKRVELNDRSPCYTAPYRDLWQTINGIDNPAAWERNPWVWVIEFKRVNP